MVRKSKPYATMADGPDAYLFRKDGKQKLVGSADNEPDAGEEELAEDESYQYRTETDYEEDNSKIWHYGKAPGGEWEIIDRSPYAEMDKFAWDLYVDFHKRNGRWPNQKESRKIEDLEYKVMTKMNEELNKIRALAGLPPIAEDCDETPGEDKNEDGECSPFTHADDNVDMVNDEQIGEDIFDEDFLVPPKDKYDNEHQDAMDRFEDDYADEMDFRATASPEADDDDWDAPEMELDRQTDYNAPSRYDGDDSYDFDEGADSDDSSAMECPACKDIAFVSQGVKGDIEEFECENCHHYGTFSAMNEGPGDEDEFDADPDAMVDVGDDEDYEDRYDFEDEFEKMMGNTSRFESVEEQIVAMNEIRKAAGLAPIEEAKPDFLDLDDDGDTEEDMKDAAEDKEKVEEAEGDTCSRCRKGKMERGETFFGPAERCNHCNYQRQLRESSPHGSDDYDFFSFDDDKAYFLVADEIGDRIIFGMNNEVGIPEQYVDGIVALLKDHGFEPGNGYKPAGMEEDLQNGYGEHEYADSYDDYFPRGATSSPARELGPAGAKHGDNPMRTPMASVEKDDVYEGMRQKYRRYRLS